MHYSPLSSVREQAPFGAFESEDLIKVFNTAVVGTQAGPQRDFSTELNEVVDSAAFRSLLVAAKHLAGAQKISEERAAEEIIGTLRKLDRLWRDYLVQEGMDRLLKPDSTPTRM